mmetsp:Transcript_16578/g.28744  ORF Transcript_16578/g.28744 Transcript_16578/m.28744 type:complete len:207 (+) Transcript_16578:1994-2614(+)
MSRSRNARYFPAMARRTCRSTPLPGHAQVLNPRSLLVSSEASSVTTTSFARTCSRVFFTSSARQFCCVLKPEIHVRTSSDEMVSDINLWEKSFISVLTLSSSSRVSTLFLSNRRVFRNSRRAMQSTSEGVNTVSSRRFTVSSRSLFVCSAEAESSLTNSSSAISSLLAPAESSHCVRSFPKTNEYSHLFKMCWISCRNFAIQCDNN